MSINYVFFDADNTLLDFKESSRVSFLKLMEEVQHDGAPLEVFSHFNQVSNRLWALYEQGAIKRDVIRLERFRQTFDAKSISFPVDEASQIYLDHICENVILIPHALEVCKKLKSLHYMIGILTNGIREVQEQRFANTNLSQFIDFFFMPSKKVPPKPNPKMFQLAHDYSGNPLKSSCLMVGDNLFADIYGANQFGYQTAWYNPHNDSGNAICDKGATPNYTFQCLTEIYKLLD